MDLIFNQYIKEANNWSLKGWDFEDLKSRWIESSPTWSYRNSVLQEFNDTTVLLDMGTGGGEFLSSLPGLPEKTFATESYKPNIPVARSRLNALGIEVLEFDQDSNLPFENNLFDLVINKHESFDPLEVFRILKPGGIFVTQQVGGKDNEEINIALDSEVEKEFGEWNLYQAALGLKEAGFMLIDQLEEYLETTFKDVGVVICFLKAIPWQVPDFSIEKYENKLLSIHKTIERYGSMKVKSHRFFIKAMKPID